jgi:hypothetical protein
MFPTIRHRYFTQPGTNCFAGLPVLILCRRYVFNVKNLRYLASPLYLLNAELVACRKIYYS